VIDAVIRSSLQLLKTRAVTAGLNFWEVLELGLEVKAALDALDKLPPGTAAPPVEIPDGPGLVYQVVVTKQARGTPISVTAAVVAPPPAPPVSPTAAAATAVPTLDPVLEKAREVTNDEMGVFGVEWMKALLNKDFSTAERIAQATLLAEHYRSFMPDEPTPEQLSTLSALRVEAKRVRDTSGYGL